MGLPGGKYREAAENLKAAGFGWVKEQTFKDALRGKPPAENTIPANAPGVRELVLTLLAIWPEFKWERLLLDPPEAWLEGCDTPLRQPAQNDEIAQPKSPREPQETWKVAPAAMRTHREPCNLQLPTRPEEPEDPVTIVPLKETGKTKFAPARIA